MTKKYLDLKEFTEHGYLHEVNRLILHPLGLALEMSLEDDGTYTLSGVWDNREDPEGICFAEPNPQKVENVAITYMERLHAREKALGYMIQPVDAALRLDTNEYMKKEFKNA